MELLARISLGNTWLSWLLATGAALATLATLLVIQRIFLRRLALLAQKTDTELDDLVVELLRSTRLLTLLAFSIYIGTRFLSFASTIHGFIRLAMLLSLMLQVALWAKTAVSFMLQGIIRKRMEGDAAGATALGLLDFVAKLAIWSAFLLLALENLGVNVTGLVTGLGIGGIAVALALQNVLGDLFASLAIVLDKPFVLGDFLVVQDALGTVEHIGLKTTRIRSLSGEQIIFPNGELLKRQIRNFKRMTERRVLFTLGVIYQTPQDKLLAIPVMLQRIIEAQPTVRFDRAHFKEFGASALVFEIVYFVLDPDYNLYMDIQQVINQEIFRQFENAGLAFAYPSQTLFIAGDSREPAAFGTVSKGHQ
jgi:small-conductance mechanosensitive channel